MILWVFVVYLYSPRTVIVPKSLLHNIRGTVVPRFSAISLTSCLESGAKAHVKLLLKKANILHRMSIYIFSSSCFLVFECSFCWSRVRLIVCARSLFKIPIISREFVIECWQVDRFSDVKVKRFHLHSAFLHDVVVPESFDACHPCRASRVGHSRNVLLRHESREV